MRILQVINSLTLAGAERLVVDLVPCLEQRGVEVSLLLLQILNSPFEHQLRERGVRLLRVADGGVYSPAHAFQVARAMEEHDLVHVHLFPAQLWAVLAAQVQGGRVPLLTTEHGAKNERRKPWLHPFDAWLYRRYASIACNSEATASALRQWVPGVAERLTVIPNGVDLGRFSARPTAGTNKQPVITFVARMESQKDHATALRALAQVPGAVLQLVGDGPLEPELRRLAEDLGIATRVRFLGQRDDVPELLRASDIYLHSSPSEGFGLAVLEAMAAGLPIVASRDAALTALVGDAGELVPPGDAAAMASALCRLVESPAERARLAALAGERARRFSIEATADAYIAEYQRILGKVA